MNYPDGSGFENRRQGQPARKPNFMLLLMLAVMAFYLYYQYQKSQVAISADRESTLPKAPDSIALPEIIIPDFSNDGLGRSDKSQTSPGSASRSTIPRSTARPTRDDPFGDRKTDWSIDMDVPTTGSRQESELSLDLGNSSAPREARTQSGDWSLEEGASHRHTKSAPKRTQKGDWEISEVESRK